MRFKAMNTIELQQTLPEVFAGRDGIVSDIWHRQVAFQKGKSYLIEAASGTGKSSLCSFVYGYPIMCFCISPVQKLPFGLTANILTLTSNND